MKKTLLMRFANTLFLSVCFFISGVSYAEVKNNFPDFEEFPGAVLLNEKVGLKATSYKLPLGTLKRKEGRLQPEFEKRLLGEVSHLTYEVGRDTAPSEVFRYFLDFFTQQKNYQALYRCESRACGSNNHWANVIFSQRVLNGLVDTQRYVALRAPFASKVDYIALYFVQRGNKKNYIHLDFVDIENQREGEVRGFSQVSTKGFVVLSALSFSPEGELNLILGKKMLDDLGQWLSQNSHLHLAIVGHTASRDDVDVAIKQSKQAADSLLGYVLKRAKKEGQAYAELSAYGVGPLVPRNPELTTDSDFWLELVRVSP